MNLHKIVKIIAAVFGILGILSLFYILYTGDTAIKDQFMTDGTSPAINPIYIIGVLLLVLVTAIVLIFTIKGILSGNLKKTLTYIGVFLGVVLISFILADGTEVKSVTNEIIASESTSKWVSTGLNTFYLLAIAAIGTMVWTGFNKIKK